LPARDRVPRSRTGAAEAIAGGSVVGRNSVSKSGSVAPVAAVTPRRYDRRGLRAGRRGGGAPQGATGVTGVTSSGRDSAHGPQLRALVTGRCGGQPAGAGHRREAAGGDELLLAPQLRTHFLEQLGEFDIEGAADRREQFRGRFLLTAFDLTQVPGLTRALADTSRSVRR
jgi:hypothetical protein